MQIAVFIFLTWWFRNSVLGNMQKKKIIINKDFWESFRDKHFLGKNNRVNIN
jgi:hypothetical protein